VYSGSIGPTGRELNNVGTRGVPDEALLDNEAVALPLGEGSTKELLDVAPGITLDVDPLGPPLGNPPGNGFLEGLKPDIEFLVVSEVALVDDAALVAEVSADVTLDAEVDPVADVADVVCAAEVSNRLLERAEDITAETYDKVARESPRVGSGVPAALSRETSAEKRLLSAAFPFLGLGVGAAIPANDSVII
jgi:hypothetical protein